MMLVAGLPAMERPFDCVGISLFTDRYLTMGEETRLS